MRSKFKWIFTLLVAFTMQLSFAQEKTVKGIVTDATGPMPGVNVVVKGTQRGVSTGFDGVYSIKANAGEVLVFSFMGMNDILRTVDASGVVNVKMQEDAKVLDAVVITATGKKQDKSIGYAVQKVAGSSLTEARESNLVNALSGKISGVQVTSSSGSVGASSRIVLRGNSSITGNNQALFVVDGVPFDNGSGAGLSGIANRGGATATGGRDLPNGVASINPDDIESVTVLKGPNAAALYGIRAAQGVILITTKKGKNNDNLGVSINSNITFSTPLVLPDFQNSYGQTYGTPGVNFFQFTDGSSGTTPDGTDESWGAPLDRGFNFVQWDSFKYGGAATPWVSYKNNVRDFYETGVTQSNSISLSGGGEKADFRFSVGNSDEKGMMPFTDFKKFNVSGNGNLKLGSSVTAGVNFSYFNDKSNNLPTTGYDGDNPTQQFIYSARQINFSDLKDWRNFPLATAGDAKGSPLNWNTQFQNNPYWTLENNTNTYDRDRIVGKFNLGYKISKSLSITGNVALDSHNTLTTGRQAFNSANNRFVTGRAANGNFDITTSRYTETNADVLLAYKTKLTDNIDFSINGGANKMKRVRTFLYGAAQDLELEGLYALSNVKSGTTLRYLNNYNEQRINSVYGFGQLSYKSFVYIDFTGRNDWASVLPSSSNSFFYPSVAGSLVLSDILKTQSVGINLLKLRAGWSKVGSTGALTAYNLNDSFTLTPGAFGNLGTVPNTEFSKDLTPETTIGKEIGLDLNAFNNRLRFAGTYYNQTAKDLLLAVDVSAGSGFLFSWQNAGMMENKGIELQLGATLVKTNKFSFDVDLNFAKNKNQVVSLGILDSYEIGNNGWGATLQARPGLPYGAIVGTDWKRDPSGNIVNLNGIPVADTEKQVVIGNITPDWTGGANFTFKYGNLELSSLIDAKIGGDVVSMTHAFGRTAGNLEETLVGREGGLVGEGVKNIGTDANPVYVPNDVVVSAYDYNSNAFGGGASAADSGSLFDASYVKLRQVTLGYSLPKKLLKGVSIDDLKFSIVSRNLAILYRNAPHIDPETAFGNGNAGQGFEFGQSPTARSIGFNINVKF
jgi:TonB-linked SusC/RagA family outer membrane protein